MKKSHSGLWIVIAVFFIAAVYSIILFLVKSHFDVSSWVLYGATMISFLLLGVQMITVSRSDSAVVIDTSLGIITAIYFGLQLIFGGIICMCIPNIPLIPVIVGEIILLALYLIIVFLMFAAQSSNTAQDYVDQKTVQKIKLQS